MSAIFYALILLVITFLLPPLVVAAVLRYRFKGKTFLSAGVPIFYREEGAGTPVVLLHGYAVNADINWRYSGVVRALRKHYRVITLDLRGHGRSGKPHDPGQYGLEMALDVCRLLDHLGIERAHVVGYSMGGFITLKLAASYHDRLLSAIPCASGWEKTDSPFRNTLDALTDSLDRHKGYGPIIQALEPVPPPWWKIKLNDWIMGYLNDNTAMSSVMKNVDGLAVSEGDLTQCPTPVLSIVGTRDPLGVTVPQLHAVMPHHSTASIENGDHVTTILNKQYLEHLMHFIAKHSPVTPTTHP